jgi:calcium/calmodulin-dependent protein kinase I
MYGHGILKEALHIKTGKYHTCKMVSKKLVAGREFIVRLCPITIIGHHL